MKKLRIECIKRGIGVAEIENGEIPISLIRGVICNFIEIGCNLNFSYKV